MISENQNKKQLPIEEKKKILFLLKSGVRSGNVKNRSLIRKIRREIAIELTAIRKEKVS